MVAPSVSGEGKSTAEKPSISWYMRFSIRISRARETIAATAPTTVQIPSGALVIDPTAIATAAPPTTLLITAIMVPVVKYCWRRSRLTPMFRIMPMALRIRLIARPIIRSSTPFSLVRTKVKRPST